MEEASAPDSAIEDVVYDAKAGLLEHAIAPKDTDPAIDKYPEPHEAFVDTSKPPRGTLIVHLPGVGGKPSGSKGLLKEWAALGYHVIGLRYANDLATSDACTGAGFGDCVEKMRLEEIDGVDRIPGIDVGGPANGLENRLAKLLAQLVKIAPGEAWGTYLAGDAPRWERIVFSGHSHGTGTAGLVGQKHLLAGVVLLSGPYDNTSGTPAPWMSKPSATPKDRWFALTHTKEDQHSQHLVNFGAMSLPGALTSVDGSAKPPYGDSHRLETSIDTTNPHGSTASDPRLATARAAMLP
ncbi:MAG: BPSS1187 family protein [Polyangiales bacterium]